MKRLLALLLASNFVLGAEKAIVITSIPKSGTHLISKCVELLTGKDETPRINYIPQALEHPDKYFVHGHFNHEFPKNDPRVINILNIRDPRDIVASFYNAGSLYARVSPSLWNTWSEERKVRYFLYPMTSRFHIQPMMKRFRVVRHTHPEYLVVRYENLVGPEGGGTLEKQMKELRKISSYLKLKLSDAELRDVRDRLYGGTVTFKVGRIGRWREVFSPEHVALFKKHYQKDLVKLGYEKDENW